MHDPYKYYLTHGKDWYKILTKNGVEVDVRIVSAMNVEPEDAIEQGYLREDLFYRLSVVRVSIPPLRNRKGDIKLLTNHFIEVYNKKMGKCVEKVSEIVENIFTSHPWTGNVRELQNAIESTFNFLESDTISLKDIPKYLYENNKLNISSGTVIGSDKLYLDLDNNIPLNEKLETYEKNLINSALKENETLADTARYLGISAQSLQYKLKKYNLL